jgi:Fe-S-cluster containining protein
MNHTSKKEVKKMPKDDKGTTFSFDVCSKCKTICCQNAKPPISSKRKKIIQKHLKNQKINIKEPFTKEDYSYPSVDQQEYCKLFNKETGKCQVHTVKPETCVAGPITFDINFSTRKLEWFLKKSEICAYAGILYHDKISLQDHFEVAKKQITELVKQLNANELRAIMKIDEPQTFKVGEDDLPIEVTKKLRL